MGIFVHRWNQMNILQIKFVVACRNSKGNKNRLVLAQHIWFGSLYWRSLNVCNVWYWYCISLYDYTGRAESQSQSRSKDSGLYHRSQFAIDLRCNWNISEQLNGCMYKKRMANPCIESIEGVLFWSDNHISWTFRDSNRTARNLFPVTVLSPCRRHRCRYTITTCGGHDVTTLTCIR